MNYCPTRSSQQLLHETLETAHAIVAIMVLPPVGGTVPIRARKESNWGVVRHDRVAFSRLIEPLIYWKSWPL
jgi:hypothetical protein